MKRNYSKISTYFIENIWIVIPLCITALLFDGLMCFLPLIEGKAIDSLKLNDYDLVLHYCLMFLGLMLFVQINRFFKRFLVRVFGNKISLRMRSVSLDNLFKKDLSYFTNNKTGDILNRNLSDIADTTEGIRKITTEVFDTVVLLIGYLIVMFIKSYELALISIPFILASILTSHYMRKIVYKRNKEYKEYLSSNKNITITRLNNELYYRGFGCSKDYYSEYDESLEILRKKATRAYLLQSSLEPIYLCIAMVGLGLISYIGGMKIINNPDGAFTIGTLAAFITTYSLVGRKAGKVGKLFNTAAAFRVSWQRCKVYLEPVEDNNINLELNDTNLYLNNFSYQYDTSFKLPEISLSAKAGDIIGVCGRVHTGKTTLLRALSGLYSYSGSGKLSDIDISQFKYDSKQYISYCSNNVLLFSDSIKNNIVLNREGNLNKALAVSALDNDLESIGGLDSILSHSNPNISGGQQKRLQMARALYPDTKLILLDDPFQSVDKNLADKMIEELNTYKDKIIVLVSNNSKILANTSKIIYLERDLAYCDTYDSLLNNNDGFKRLMEVVL